MIPEPVTHDLGQVQHELIIVFETGHLDPDDPAIVTYPNEQVATLSVEKGRNGFEHWMRHAPIDNAAFMKAVAKGWLEVEGLGLILFNQPFDLAVPTLILIEQQVLDRFAERPVVGDPLVQPTVNLDDLLDDLLDLLVGS